MAFQAYLTSTTNYTEAPTGLIENQTFEEWVSKNQMEIVSRDGNTVKLEAEWGNGEGVDTYEVELLDITEATEIKVGSSVRVIPHTTYQHLSHGAVIDPMIEHEHDGYETTVTRIFREDMEDENGNPVVELIYEVATGELFNRSQLQVI